jgi:hypothetical protein
MDMLEPLRDKYWRGVRNGTRLGQAFSQDIGNRSLGALLRQTGNLLLQMDTLDALRLLAVFRPGYYSWSRGDGYVHLFLSFSLTPGEGKTKTRSSANGTNAKSVVPPELG